MEIGIKNFYTFLQEIEIRSLAFIYIKQTVDKKILNIFFFYQKTYCLVFMFSYPKHLLKNLKHLNPPNSLHKYINTHKN